MDKQKHKQYRKAQFCLEVVIISSRVSVKTTRLHHCLGTVKRLNSFFTSSSGSIWKASFCLHEFCWQWKLPTSIVNIWVFIYFFFTDMLTKVFVSRHPKTQGHPDEGPRRTHGNIHPQLVPKIYIPVRRLSLEVFIRPLCMEGSTFDGTKGHM